MHPNRPRPISGLSLPELMILIGVIGVLAAIAVASGSIGGGVSDAVKEVKLEQELQVLNSAVSSYLASGGGPFQGENTR